MKLSNSSEGNPMRLADMNPRDWDLDHPKTHWEFIRSEDIMECIVLLYAFDTGRLVDGEFCTKLETAVLGYLDQEYWEDKFRIHCLKILENYHLDQDDFLCWAEKLVGLTPDEFFHPPEWLKEAPFWEIT